MHSPMPTHRRRFLRCPACGQPAPTNPKPGRGKSAITRFTAEHEPYAAVQNLGGYAGMSWISAPLTADERALLVAALERALRRLRAR